MIKVSNLQKSYGDLVAVDQVSFSAEAGTVFGLLGPNGAGKSTTISCISGLLKPTGGSISVGGFDMNGAAVKAKASLGIVPQELAIYEDLSAMGFRPLDVEKMLLIIPMLSMKGLVT